MTAVLQSLGVPAHYCPLDKLLADKYTQPLDQSFYTHLTDLLREKLKNRPNGVLVVTGYMGSIPGGILDTIGRGYTDLTAALIAVATGAKELQIWKEVDGIFTADPRKVPNAKLLEFITPEETAEITYYGSEVIHPFTMEQVIRADIPIRIKNTFHPQKDGTLIIPGSFVFESDTDSSSDAKKKPTAVTVKEGVIVLNVNSNRKSVSHGFFEKMFSILDHYGIVVDLVSTSQVNVSMALAPSSSEKLECAIVDLKKYGILKICKSNRKCGRE
jgi:aspartate kinase